MSEFVIVRGRPSAAPLLAAFDPNEQLRRAAAADTAERLTRPVAPSPTSDALIYETLRNEKLAAESGEGAARVAAAEAERQVRETVDVAALTRRSHNRAQTVLRLATAGTADSLRADLRIASAHRDSAAAAHRDAEAELARARQTVVDTVVELATFHDLDAERDAAAAAAFRAGTLGTADPVIAEKVAAQGAATARLDAAQRAEKVVAAALGETHAALLNASERVEVLAAALVVVQADAFAAALEEIEQRAATLRTRLLSAANLWLTAPGMAPYAMPATDRMRRLISNPAANSLAKPDGKTAEAFRKHFAALLADPDASLAAAD